MSDDRVKRVKQAYTDPVMWVGVLAGIAVAQVELLAGYGIAILVVLTRFVTSDRY